MEFRFGLIFDPLPKKKETECRNEDKALLPVPVTYEATARFENGLARAGSVQKVVMKDVWHYT